MLDKVIKVIAVLFGLALLLTGVRWQVDPAGAAENL